MMPVYYLFSAGRALGVKGKRQAAAATILFADYGSYCLRRHFTFALGRASLGLASIQAARLAVLALHHGLDRSGGIDIIVDSDYVSKVLERSGAGYAIEPKTNVAEVEALRSLCSGFATLSYRYDKDHPLIKECGSLARQAAMVQSTTDSKTMRFPDAKQAGYQNG